MSHTKESQKRVLIVEDDPLLLRVLSESFAEQGYHISTVENGLEVMKAVKEFNPDLILLDLILPGMDGFSLLKQLKDDSPIDERALLLQRLKKLGVKICTETMAVSIGKKSILVEKHQKRKSIPMKTVVLCLGSFPNNGLFHELKKVVQQVFVVGDALEPRRVTDAMSEGALAVLSI